MAIAAPLARRTMVHIRSLTLLVAALVLLLAPSARAQEPDFATARREMVRQIEFTAAVFGPATGFPAIDRRVLDAFGKVPRHRFVPPPLVPFAYMNMPLPLGYEQNLTQPFLLVLMTQALQLKPGDRVFETGTDTGYQAAILAELGVQVFSVEIVEPLFDIAQQLLPALGYGNVALRLGDGYHGWAEMGPYDAMLIKESVDEIPGALWLQLKSGGRMVIPLGPPDGEQVLTLAIKHADGRSERIPLLPVRFAPFQGGRRI
ncbi:MAG: protein-L-isoaspartate O-methyltransferase [Betaproteobacteria bacterium]|nr:protein-L-isoaspartate O-methyltransferase [Betaproteobacteria bacterium]